MRVLVTGGAGFIGRATVESLLADGHEVRVLDRRDPVPEAAPDGVEHLLGDLRDADTVASALRGVDAVSHQAARVGLGLDLQDLPAYASDNDLATAVLLAGMALRDPSRPPCSSSPSSPSTAGPSGSPSRRPPTRGTSPRPSACGSPTPSAPATARPSSSCSRWACGDAAGSGTGTRRRAATRHPTPDRPTWEHDRCDHRPPARAEHGRLRHRPGLRVDEVAHRRRRLRRR